VLEPAQFFPLLVLHSRQLYGLGLPPGSAAIDVKLRACRPFVGKDMVYDRPQQGSLLEGAAKKSVKNTA
jgi:hypothetical protein